MDSIRKIKNWGFVLLAIWLILYGALPLLGISSIPPVILEVLAIAAGVLILLNR